MIGVIIYIIMGGITVLIFPFIKILSDKKDGEKSTYKENLINTELEVILGIIVVWPYAFLMCIYTFFEFLFFIIFHPISKEYKQKIEDEYNRIMEMEMSR